MVVYHRETTFQQRKRLFEIIEETKNISNACRDTKISRSTYYRWEPRYEKDGVEGLFETKSHAAHGSSHDRPTDREEDCRAPEGASDTWGKKRIARVDMERSTIGKKWLQLKTVRNVLDRHGMWNPEKKKKRKKNDGTTADKPNKTINIDLNATTLSRYPTST